VSDIDACFEDGLTVEEIQNRLGWGWHFLAQYAHALGGRYRDRVYCSCNECNVERAVWAAPVQQEGRVH
jgi:hypothetical protein